MNNLDKLVRNLLPLPSNVLDIKNICSGPNGSVGEIMDVVKRDPFLALDILKLGMSKINTIVIKIGAKKFFNKDLRACNISTETFARSCELQEYFAKLLFQSNILKEKLDWFLTCAFLQELGKVFIATDISEQNKIEDFQKDFKQFSRIAKAKHQYLSLTVAQIRSKIFNIWGFGEKLFKPLYSLIIPIKALKHLRKFALA